MTDFDEFGGMGDDVLLSMDLDNLVSPIAKKTAKKNMPCTPALPAKPSCAKEIMPSTPASSAKPSCSTDDPTPEAPVRTRKNAAKKQISLHRGIERSLKKFLGHDNFRCGQHESVSAILSGRDGSGKSLVYQLPALYLHKTALVVSPLISLMQDQVQKLNNTLTLDGPQEQIACFLGSAQLNPEVEARALAGEFPIVYLTPEKLCSGFLERLDGLYSSGNISLLAIDEAHCVSSWGHEFRQDYANLGCFRDRYPDVPIVALTATAVPRVQADIVSSLRLRNPYNSQQSVDRPNLKITMRQTIGKAPMMDLARQMMRELESTGGVGSTIVYARTRKETEEIALCIQEALSNTKIRVAKYHAGMDVLDREAAHRAFMTGQTHIVVATVAFGMGIDKPDIRRVWNYGPPKTMELYYQMIGRAGRDGLPAECVMLYTPSAFIKYSDDFYTKHLTPERREVVLRSTCALRDAAESRECRRVRIMRHFGELPSFVACGTCDNCARALGGQELRDYSRQCHAILSAANGLSLSKLSKVVKGFDLVPKKETCTALVSNLTSEGYLERETRTFQADSYAKNINYEVYFRSKKADRWMINSQPLMLPVPTVIMEAEAKAAAKAAMTRKKLVDAGFDLSKLPPNEVSEGKGATISYYTKWVQLQQRLRAGGPDTARVADKNEMLLATVRNWRNETAQKLGLSPHHVLPEHLILGICTSRLHSVQALTDLGVRIRGVKDLATLLLTRLRELGLQSDPATNAGDVEEMELPELAVRPLAPWKLNTPSSSKKMPPWSVSHNRFERGESLQSIASNQLRRKPISVNTVVIHLLKALTWGKAVPLRPLSVFVKPPNKTQWQQLEKVFAKANIDPFNTPDKKISKKELIHALLGAELASDWKQAAPYYGFMNWYLALKRVRYEPVFAASEGASSSPGPSKRRSEAAAGVTLSNKKQRP